MVPPDDERTKKRQAGMAQAGQLLGAGLQFTVTIIIATMGGWWLDDRLSTSPLLLIAGMLFGATAAFYHLYTALPRPDGTLTRPDSEDGDGPATAQDPEAKGEKTE